MDYTKNSVGHLAIVLFLIAGVLFVSLRSPTISNVISPFHNNQCSSSPTKQSAMVTPPPSPSPPPPPPPSPPPPPEDELETALKGTSMENKTLIIVIVNKAYVEGEKSMFDIFIESLWVGEETQSLLDHILFVAVDQFSFNKCNFMRRHCYRLVTDGGDDFVGEKFYMSRGFINMMWRRTLFLSDVLKRGYSFIFTDADVMWLRNPFLRLSRNESDHIQLSCDTFSNNECSVFNLINTGFYFVRSNDKTISLFDTWYAMKDNANYTGMKEQDVLKEMMHRGVLRQLGLNVRFLDTLYFSGFCENSKDFGAVITVHSNCCRTIKAKVIDLTAVLKDWNRYKSSIAYRKMLKGPPGNETLKYQWSNHIQCGRSWIGFNASMV